jgi:hypothetical protein
MHFSSIERAVFDISTMIKVGDGETALFWVNTWLGGQAIEEIVKGFRSKENKKIPTKTNKNKPRSDLRDAKQQVREIRSTYPCRSHSGNVQMNIIGVVVLASPPCDPI